MIQLLKSVSRSFYLSLRILPTTLRPAISLGYLLCRAADSISDTDAFSPSERRSALNQLKAILSTFPLKKNEFNTWGEGIKQFISPSQNAENRLLDSMSIFFSFFEKLSKTEQALIQDVALGVIQGMEMDLTLFGDSIDTVQELKTERDLERYLLLIGGEPGRFWTKLCLAQLPALKIKNNTQWIEDGIQFGTGLQMVNILRDIKEDLNRGRCYIPIERLKRHNLSSKNLINNENSETFLTLYHELIDETINRLDHGMEYIFQISKINPRLRLAVWWPLILGVKTLKKLKNTPDILKRARKVKIKRWDLYGLIAGSLFLVFSNRLLERMYRNA